MKIHFVYLGIILVLVGVLLATALTPHFALDRNFDSGMLIGIGVHCCSLVSLQASFGEINAAERKGALLRPAGTKIISIGLVRQRDFHLQR